MTPTPRAKELLVAEYEAAGIVIDGLAYLSGGATEEDLAALRAIDAALSTITTLEARVAEMEGRIRLARSSVGESPFYTLAQRVAVGFVLDLIEFNEPRAALATPAPVSADPEALAQRFHETYERLAPSFGYETREASAKPWADVPDQNKRLMIAVCAEILKGPSHAD